MGSRHTPVSMPERLGPGQHARVYVLTLGLFVSLTALRLAYVLTSRAPVPLGPAHVFFGLSVLMLSLGAVYSFIRPDLRLACLLNASGLLLMGGIASSTAAVLVFHDGRFFPLVDAQLAALDRMLGFDWMAWLRWFDDHPGVNEIVRFAYESIFWQPFVIVPALALALQARRLYAFVLAKIVSLTATCVCALFLPALGTYEFFDVTAAEHPRIVLAHADKMTGPILWLRAAVFDTPFETEVGLISFPSFHAALAVIYAWAACCIPVIGWLALVLNALMLAATPVQGSHYLADVIAGGVVAVASIWVADWATRRALRRGNAAPMDVREPETDRLPESREPCAPERV